MEGGAHRPGALGVSPGAGGGRVPGKDDPAALPAGLSSPPRLRAVLPVPGFGHQDELQRKAGEVGPRGSPPPQPGGCVRIPLCPPPVLRPRPGDPPRGTRHLPRPHPPLQTVRSDGPLFLPERWLLQPLNIKSGH